MPRAALSAEQNVEEDFIDMDFTVSPPPAVEFEFKMADDHLERPPLTSPADELFYKGKLLPLYLPPRLQMVEKLLLTAVSDQYCCWSERYDKRSLASAGTAPSSPAATPFESCYASAELNPDDYFYEEGQSAQLIQSTPPPPPPCPQKIKFIKRSIIYSKLKAYKAYIKFLFAKSNENCEVSKAKVCSNPKREKAKIKPATSAAMAMNEGDEDFCKRRSFSRSLKQQSTVKSCSSSSSSSSSFSSSNSSSFSSMTNCDELEGSQPLMLKRSSSASSDHVSSIQGAIAYCKKSQQRQISVRRSVSDVDYRNDLRV